MFLYDIIGNQQQKLKDCTKELVYTEEVSFNLWLLGFGLIVAHLTHF